MIQIAIVNSVEDLIKVLQETETKYGPGLKWTGYDDGCLWLKTKEGVDVGYIDNNN